MPCVAFGRESLTHGVHHCKSKFNLPITRDLNFGDFTADGLAKGELEDAPPGNETEGVPVGTVVGEGATTDELGPELGLPPRTAISGPGNWYTNPMLKI